MDIEESRRIMAVIRTAYPTYYHDMSENELIQAVKLWAEMFVDDPARDVAAAVKAYMATDTKGFPPSIGQIKAKMQTIGTPDHLPETAAWAFVRKAIADGIYHANEQFDALPETVRVCVTPDLLREWAMDESASEQVIASNFMRSYREAVKYQKELDALPEDVKKLIEDKALKRLE